jgi:hypothetical protein
MPETPEELWARAAGALSMPPVEEWETFPFEGAMRPRKLAPPVDREPARAGAGRIECSACNNSDDATSGRTSSGACEASASPRVFPLSYCSRRVSTTQIPGTYQTLGRPACRSFAAIWDDVLPPLPEELWRENLKRVATALER